MDKLTIQLVKKCLYEKDIYLDLGGLGLRDDDFAKGSTLDKLLSVCSHIQTLILSNRWTHWETSGKEYIIHCQSRGVYNKLTMLPPALLNLENLYALIISGDSDKPGGISDTSSLANLTKLKQLNISNNQITEIKGLDSLISLQQLDISNNQITEIKGLNRLARLQQLNISNNQITEIKGLDRLVSLQQLNISNNQITEIKGLDNLLKLQQLNVSNNQVVEIKQQNGLPNLRKFNLSQNRITDISPLIPLLERNENRLNLTTGYEKVSIGELGIAENPLTTPPREIVERGNDAVLRFFAGQLEPAFEAKLLVVGEPEAGKTTLIKKMINSSYKVPNEEDSTTGIQVVKWQCEYTGMAQSMKLNVWDFGGQEMQYLTHQFFLSSDALYILLTSARKDLDNLDYWFNIISLLGKNEKGENSELLVVANEIKMQEGQTGKTFDVKKYRDLYPHLPFQFHAVNLATAQDGDGRFATLQHLIKKKLVNLPVMGRQLPVKWGVVRQQLTSSNINYIPINEYLALCKNAGVEEKFALDLSNYLHKIGEAVHFQNDHTVNSFVILNPKWAVDGIYSILKRNDIADNGGHFIQQQVYAVWEKEGYTFGEKNMLLNLMVKDSFEVAYKIPGKADEYIAPQLLPLVQPEHKWDKIGALHFRYLYPFMPKGIVTRLIVRLHEDIKYVNGKGLVWRSGVIFEKLGCKAKVEETKIVATGQQVIAIEIIGHAAHRKLLLYDICRTIERIHKDAFSKIVFERQVPCACSHCQTLEQPGFYNYTTLLKYLGKNRKEIVCEKEVANEPAIKDILDDIFDIDFTMMDEDAMQGDKRIERNMAFSEDPFGANKPMMKPKKIFISYSKYDEEFKEEFHSHLVTLREQGLAYDFNCKQIDLGAEWDPTIQQEIDDCDMMICLVSKGFLNTPYIRNNEVKVALEKGKQVIPVIIKPCDWENSNIGQLYAPLRGKPVSLNHEKLLRNIIEETTPIERDAHWNNIIKELREKVFKT
jgi:internalin A